MMKSLIMKEKIFNPASTDDHAPEKGMAAVNTWNSEEIDNTESEKGSEPKNFEREEQSSSDDNSKS
jgi:hypothetical protein